MRGLVITRRIGVLAAAAMSLWAQPAAPGDAAKQLLVRIEGKLNGATEVGGGTIVQVAPALDRVYIVTANHVVRLKDDDDTPATDIKVRFRWSPESFPADLMEHFDKSADLAVIRLRNIKDLGLPQKLPLDQVGASAGLRVFSKVYTLGFPDGRPWFQSVTPDAISDLSGDWVNFQAAFLAKGYSGGMLLNESFQPVGMILKDAPPESKALRMEYVIRRLGEWGYTPDLRITGGLGAPNSTATRTVRLMYADCTQDGSSGTTRWDLKATVNGQQLFDWKGRDVSDERGKNRLTPAPGEALLEVPATGDLEIEVKGDHTVGNPKPISGKVTAKGPGQFSVPAKANPERDGSFNFVFVVEEKK
jgi:hypothetical protein